jgi:hypothetical protein
MLPARLQLRRTTALVVHTLGEAADDIAVGTNKSAPTRRYARNRVGGDECSPGALTCILGAHVGPALGPKA